MQSMPELMRPDLGFLFLCSVRELAHQLCIRELLKLFPLCADTVFVSRLNINGTKKKVANVNTHSNRL